MTRDQSWRKLPVTDKQWGAIKRIEENTRYRYNRVWRTRGTAFDFIAAHIDESMEIAKSEEQVYEDTFYPPDMYMDESYFYYGD